ncbi:MAG: hypothetical protein WCL51_06305 [Bacteroidota bacterium]
MDKNIIKEMISRQLDLIIEQFNNLDKHKGKISQIDIDIIKRNVSILYEQLFELEKENTSSLFDKHKEKKPEIKAKEEPPIAKIIEEKVIEVEEDEVTFPVDTTPEPVEEEPEPIFVKEPEPIVVIEEEPELIPEQIVVKEEPPVLIEELTTLKEKTPEIIEEFTTLKEDSPIFIAEKPIHIEEKVIVKEEPAIIKEEPVNIEEPVMPEPPKPIEKPIEKKVEKHTDLFGGGTTIADKFKKDTKTVIDRLHIETSNKTIGHRHQQHAIQDLKSAIGINEKFLFINELFKGNMKVFNDTIIKLNDFASHTEAEAFLLECKHKYNWPDDLVSYLTLKDFVIRRYL